MDHAEPDDIILLSRTESREYELVGPEVEATIKSIPIIYRCYPIKENESANVQPDTFAPDSNNSMSVQQPPANPPQQALGSSSQQRKETARKLLDSLPRFGPSYAKDDIDISMKFIKKKAWQHVMYKSGEEVELTKQKFTAAIRTVEKKAREAYPEDVAGRRSEFRKMMIIDGCFFIQLAFMILGKNHVDLGYPKTDLVFGGKKYKKEGEWLEAMFYPGNQIPLVVLEELLKQKFFQEIINKGNWCAPVSDLRKTILYKLLVQSKEKNIICSNRFFSLANIWGVQARAVEQPPSDVLQCLHSFFLGPAAAGNEPGIYKARYDLDLEANYSDDDVLIDNDQERNFPGDGETTTASRNFVNPFGARNAMGETRRIFPSALELETAGIHIKKLKTGGARSISFESYYFSANLWLPSFKVNEDMEIVLRTLKTYEMSNKQFGNYDREICSCISFMSDILQTPHDLSYLQKIGIIEGAGEYVDRLPGLLKRLNTRELILTYNLRNVRRQIRNYSSPLVRYQNILNFVVFLTIVQAVFAVLAYFKPPK